MTKITQLPQDTSPTTDDFTISVDTTSGQAKKLLLSDLITLISANISAGSIGSTEIDFGGAGAGIWWQEIGRTTLTSANTTISVSGFAAKTYIKIIFNGISNGSTLDTGYKFNNDSSANYAWKGSNGGVFSGGTSATSLPVEGGIVQANGAEFFTAEFSNILAKEKVGVFSCSNPVGAGAATAPQELVGVAKWSNTSAQITRVDFTSSNNMAIGSEVIVLGHD